MVDIHPHELRAAHGFGVTSSSHARTIGHGAERRANIAVTRRF